MTDAARWQAVLDRDRRFDGAFVFAVRTTGVYCRPGCAARRPRRRNVVFFGEPDDAERAGFRGCRRCRPKEAVRGGAALVEQVCRDIEVRLAEGEPVRLAGLAARVGLSPHHLLRSFKHAVGVTPRQYADARRITALKARLKEGMPVTHATYEAGYGSSSRLYERSDALLGMTPATYSHGGRGARIRYGIASCPLGRVLVAGTERGVAAVYFGDTDRPLEAALRAEYPQAEVRRDDAANASWVRAVVAGLRGEQAPNLPLDVRATAFQWRVFEALRRIPAGETRTYGEIARSIGAPRAARAVGRACATNRVAVVIPCHRAVGSGGSLTGYRWGVARKKALLATEAARSTKAVAAGGGRRR
jgi:AraC family transcriptional regulator, regulatory protein of adaptative response / methylated-DNA-[protein]-cysteine methyltransferase